jgi:hypothetical protein
VVAAQPLLEPSYDPLRQQISEFVHTSAGTIVLAGFLAWGASLLFLAGVVTGVSPSPGSRLLPRAEGAALVAAAFGLVLVTCFATDRGAEVAGAVTHRTTAGHIHDVGSGVVLAGILAAAVADAFRERSAALACIAISTAVASSALLFALGSTIGCTRPPSTSAAKTLAGTIVNSGSIATTWSSLMRWVGIQPVVAATSRKYFTCTARSQNIAAVPTQTPTAAASYRPAIAIRTPTTAICPRM